MGDRLGVVVMAYGTPATPDDVEAYYTHVRRGRPPTPELLADLQRRYAAIGGTSPLLDVTRRQQRRHPVLDEGLGVLLAQHHGAPSRRTRLQGGGEPGALCLGVLGER